MRKLACLFACLLAGCVPIHHGDKDYQVILGFGIVGVERTNLATVVRTHSLRIHAGDGRVNLGLSSVMTTSIPTNSNVIIEIKK